MKKILALLFLASCLYADITGDISIGKSEDSYRADVKIGYDFTISQLSVIPYFEYINYFQNNGIDNYPYRDIFATGLHLNFDSIYLDVRHECRHEVSSLNSRDRPLLYSDALPNASSTFISVGYRFGRDYD